jgi:hypothetical protein
MDEARRRLIALLHGVPYQYAAAVTGGGAQVIAELLNVPGGSRTVLEAVVPYHPASLAEFLGHDPEQSCSAETSRAVARRALGRARRLVPATARPAGLGCTASLASDRPKRGEHRFYLSVATDNGVSTWALILAKGARDRPGEEGVLDTVALNALAETFGVPERLPVPLLAEESLHVESHPTSPPLARLFRGECNALCVEPDGRISEESPRPRLLLPGSFNPLHAGHCRLAEVAAKRIGLTPAFEIGVQNADKPGLTIEDVCRRVRQFAWRAPVWLTRVPTFVQKASYFPGAVFVVGYDTAVRLVHPRFYDGSADRMGAALSELQQRGCRFLVAGRAQDGVFCSLENVPVPAGFESLFDVIPPEDFRVDLSSTALREHPRNPAV